MWVIVIIILETILDCLRRNTGVSCMELDKLKEEVFLSNKWKRSLIAIKKNELKE